ncbi:hypothetical protein ACN28E_39760 [Archangium lansingense]|uniref:hypothetical protein n=1 Tax=Archangium lansingense TaxID=2995310 RepID=UPI003B7F5C57
MKPVFHSSAGSLRAGSSKGTLFWIVNGGNRILIAMGEHVTHQNNVYKINWKAQGVRVKSNRANHVTLQTANCLESV